MSLVVVTPPQPLVSVADAKAWAPVLAGDGDGRVFNLLTAAQASIEPPNGWLGRALGEQVLEARFCRFRSPCLFLPCPPLREVVSVTYRDLAGVDRTILPESLRLIGLGTSTGAVVPTGGQDWPDAEDDIESVRVRFKAGYAANDPEVQPVRHAIVLAATHLRSLGTQDLALRSRDVPGVDSRSWTVSETAAKLVRDTVEALLMPLRVYA